MLGTHLAGASISPKDQLEDPNLTPKAQRDQMLCRIAALNTGQALLFSPTALIKIEKEDGGIRVTKLNNGFLEITTRKRLTADGGRSIMAL